MTKVKLSDYLMEYLVKLGVSDIFMVSGGGIMHLIDSLGKTQGLSYISQHHEQACAIAAEAYARVNNKIGVCLVTTGPGGTNAVTGTACAWVDSIPVLFISGQVRRAVMANYKQLRQLAPQEINITEIVKPITKYAKTIMSPLKIKYEIDKALDIARSGRPGPVWLDIPLDIQGAIVETDRLAEYLPPKKKMSVNSNIEKGVEIAIKRLQRAQRPILILGHGVRLSGAYQLVEKFVNRIKAPVLLPYNGLDLLEEKNKYLMGKFGPMGSRRGNFALQNSDFILAIGASLNLTTTGFDLEGFAPKAKKMLINIDPAELNKDGVVLDYKVCGDAKDFIEIFLNETNTVKFNYPKKWENVCNLWKTNYPSIIPEFYENNRYVNTYVFFDRLSDFMTKKDTLITAVSLDSVGMYQAFKVKKGQRAFTNQNFGPMGWGLPASIGAAIQSQGQIVAVVGDGSIQFNIQELATVAYYHLPIKIFVINNNGYDSIKTMQDNHFESRYVGADINSGVTNPDFCKLAEAYNLQYMRLANNEEVDKKLEDILNLEGPVLCELNVSPHQHRVPRASSLKKSDGTMESKPLEDMWPFLPPEEIKANMSLFDKEKDK